VLYTSTFKVNNLEHAQDGHCHVWTASFMQGLI
jgi:hypothetical protein